MARPKTLKRVPAAATNKPKKIVREAKPQQIDTPTEVPAAVYRCTCCGYEYKKQEGNFNVSRSPIYKGNNGYLSICKKCLSELWEQYCKFFGGSEDDAMERICQITDMYMDEDAWMASRKYDKHRNRISVYISKLNLMQSAKGATYSDTLVKRFDAQVENSTSMEEVDENTNTSKESVRRFGYGFKEEEYEALQYEYDDWVDRYGEPEDKRQEELYANIAYLKLNLQSSVQKAAPGVASIANAYKAAIEAATTELEDRKKKQEMDVRLDPLGVMVQQLEQYAPAEFYKDKTLFKDHDGIGKYFERFIVRPMRNLLTGSKELDKEFNLGGDDRS